MIDYRQQTQTSCLALNIVIGVCVCVFGFARKYFLFNCFTSVVNI